jgi:hypothetical protein
VRHGSALRLLPNSKYDECSWLILLTLSSLSGRVLQIKCFNERSLSAIFTTVSACLCLASPDSTQSLPVKRCSQKLVTRKWPIHPVRNFNAATLQAQLAQRAHLVDFDYGRLVIKVGHHDLCTGGDETSSDLTTKPPCESVAPSTVIILDVIEI